MALKKCKECGQEVSTKADRCPNCGAKQKRKSIGCGGALLILIVLGFIGSQFADFSHKAEEKKRAAQQAEIVKKKQEAFNNARIDFGQNINKHYEELKSLFHDKKYQEVLSKIAAFKKYKKFDYKDVKSISNTSNTKLLESKARNIPSSDIEGNLKAYKQLLALNPSNTKYKAKKDYYQKNGIVI